MSLTLGAVDFFHDLPRPRYWGDLPRPRFRSRVRNYDRRRAYKLPTIPELNLSLPRPDLKFPKLRRRKVLESRPASETDSWLEVATLTNHVPSGAASIDEVFDSAQELSIAGPRYPKIDPKSFPIPTSKTQYIGEASYVYTPIKPRHIRLLQFKPSPFYAPKSVVVELGEVPLDGHPPYEALSYRWYSREATTPITCNGTKLLVPANCSRALKRLNVENRLLWVDAICINQNDNAEKSDQVLFMSEIYSKADRTLAWLGEDASLAASCISDIDAALPYLRLASGTSVSLSTNTESIKYSESSTNSIVKLLSDETLLPSLAFTKLLRRAWFSRVWILQEVALAKEVWLCCGSARTSWPVSSAVLRILNQTSRLSDDCRSAWNLVTFRKLYLQKRDEGGVDIYSALVEARGCHATNKRDKVYALLGVCDELARFVGKPNYDLPVEVVWADAMRACLRSRLSVNALCLASIGLKSMEGLPSWAADLGEHSRAWISRPRSQAESDGVAKFLHCSNNRGYCLHVWGVFVDSLVTKFEQSESRDFTMLPAVLRRWWHTFQDLDISPSELLPDKTLAFWRTLYGDIDNSLCWSPKLVSWHRRVIKGEVKWGDDTKPSVLAQEDRNLRVPTLIKSTSRRVLGVTMKKSIGLFGNEARIGDQIALFAGGTVPFLLRRVPRESIWHQERSRTCLRRNKDAYRLIGPCYVYGLMSGEAISKPPADYREILIF